MSDQLHRHSGGHRKQSIQAELRLGGWVQRGKTAARLGDRSIVVDRGIPSELVIASVQRHHKAWHGVVDRLVEPSPDRIYPPCPYYLLGCGGCQWQHLEYQAQLRAKRELVERELEAQGIPAGVSSLHEMRDPWRYRRTAAVAIGWEAGFRPRGRRGIVEVHDCLISHPLIGTLADSLNHLLRAGALPNYHGKVWLDCTVVGSACQPEVQVLIQGIEGLTREAHPELPSVAEIIAAIDGVRTVAYRHRSGEALPLVGELMSTIELMGRPMYLPAGSFFQTNLQMLELLLGRMRCELEGTTVERAADIYGGVGPFALTLAPFAGLMTLVELDAAAVRAAECTAGEWGLRNVDFISRHAELALPDLGSLDLVVVDPPRSGLGDVITAALVKRPVPLLFYVSCSPSSLARDLAALQTGGYRVRSVELFDFYPHTFHVESLAILER